jgi:hypothetical protein
MNQNSNHKFSDGERNLFKSIAGHIQANPNDYKEAGEWLNKYCSESGYWLIQDNKLEELKKKHTQFPALALLLAHQKTIENLENRIKERRTPALLNRFQEARNYLLDKYGDENFVSKEIAAKVIIITWLLTDPDAEKKKVGITELETWPWEPIDDVLKMTRSYAGFLFAQNKDAWMSLVCIAWGKIKESEEKSVLEPKPPETLQKILWVLKYGRRHWKLLFAAVFLFLCIWILPKINLFSKKHRNINSETKTDKKVEDITLLYLFENDFDNLLRASEDIILTDKDGSQTTVKSKLYLDFESQTEFVGFYIPPVPETFDICIHLAEQYKTVLELAKEVMVESSGIGLQPVNISELKFSGRVFMYHEYPLLEAQKRELFTLYQKHDLSPQFRGTDYLFKKREIEKSH